MAEIIKSAQVEQIGSRLSLFQFAERTSTVAQTRHKARRRAARVLTAARARAARIREEALDAQQRTTDRETASLASTLTVALAELQQLRESWRADWDAQLLPLALRIAEKIVRRELRNSTDISLSWIRESLELISGTGPLRLRLHPIDLREQRGAVQELLARKGLAGEVKLVEDADISAGGCLVDTPFGSIDQRLESQLSRLAEELA